MRFAAMSFLVILTGCGWMGGGVSPLIGAARSGDVDQIKQLVASGADVNGPGGVNHWTPLMHAIHKNQAGSVTALLAAGADPNAVSGRTTALIMAAGYGQADIVRILLEHGANPGAEALAAAVGGTTDIDDNTAGKCQTGAVKALMEKEPSLRLAGDSEAVQTARRGGCTEVLALVTGR